MYCGRGYHISWEMSWGLIKTYQFCIMRPWRIQKNVLNSLNFKHNRYSKWRTKWPPAMYFIWSKWYKRICIMVFRCFQITNTIKKPRNVINIYNLSANHIFKIYNNYIPLQCITVHCHHSSSSFKSSSMLHSSLSQFLQTQFSTRSSLSRTLATSWTTSGLASATE